MPDASCGHILAPPWLLHAELCGCRELAAHALGSAAATERFPCARGEGSGTHKEGRRYAAVQRLHSYVGPLAISAAHSTTPSARSSGEPSCPLCLGCSVVVSLLFLLLSRHAPPASKHMQLHLQRLLNQTCMRIAAIAGLLRPRSASDRHSRTRGPSVNAFHVLPEPIPCVHLLWCGLVCC